MNTHLGKCWHNFTILELESDVAQKKKKTRIRELLVWKFGILLGAELQSFTN